jgi:hypothetical protein
MVKKNNIKYKYKIWTPELILIISEKNEHVLV